jgi:hypothetical protein
MDMRFGADMHQSFVRYQSRLVRALDSMAKRYKFTVVDASRPADVIFRELRGHVTALRLRQGEVAPARKLRRRKAQRPG